MGGHGDAQIDPTSDSALLWTRVSAPSNVAAMPLTVEVSETPTFEQSVSVVGISGSIRSERHHEWRAHA